MVETSHEPGSLFPNALLFARSLRSLGLPISMAQLASFSLALEELFPASRRHVRHLARATLVSRCEHVEIFDRAFDLFWTDRLANRLADRAEPPVLGEMLRRVEHERASHAASRDEQGAPDAEGGEAPDGRDGSDGHNGSDGRDGPGVGIPGWTALERLRRKDFAKLTDGERREVAAWISAQPWRPPLRRTRRTRREHPRRGGALDLRRTLRAALRHGGEPIRLEGRRRVERPRPLVVLCDISGSMEPYSRILLRFMHALSRGESSVEAFVFGTRLSRITRHLAHRDPDRALAAAAAAVEDWEGGTRIGDSLRAFHRDWAHRVLRRGAIVLVISDGWDRGDPLRLSREVAHLQRTAWRLLWLNPLLGSPGYEPLTRGIRAVLPHVDAFLPVHDLASLEQLADVLAPDLRPRVC